MALPHARQTIEHLMHAHIHGSFPSATNTPQIPPIQAYRVATRRGRRDRDRARPSRERRQRSRRICKGARERSTGRGRSRRPELVARHEPPVRRGFGSDGQTRLPDQQRR